MGEKNVTISLVMGHVRCPEEVRLGDFTGHEGQLNIRKSRLSAYVHADIAYDIMELRRGGTVEKGMKLFEQRVNNARLDLAEKLESCALKLRQLAEGEDPAGCDWKQGHCFEVNKE